MSDGELRQTMTRLMSIHDEIDEKKLDLKTVYADAKSAGYDKTALGLAIRQIRGREKAESPAAQERSALVDLYVSTFDNAPRTYVHVPAREGTTQNTPERPSNRDLSAVDESSPEAGPQAEASLAGTGSGTLAGREGRTEEHPGSLPEMGVRAAQPIPEQPSVAGTESAVRAGAPAIAGLVADAGWKLPLAKPLRPHCQRPDSCGSYGSKHCGGCERAAKSAEADDDGSDVPAFIRKTHDHPSFGEQA